MSSLSLEIPPVPSAFKNSKVPGVLVFEGHSADKYPYTQLPGEPQRFTPERLCTLSMGLTPTKPFYVWYVKPYLWILWNSINFLLSHLKPVLEDTENPVDSGAP